MSTELGKAGDKKTGHPPAEVLSALNTTSFSDQLTALAKIHRLTGLESLHDQGALSGDPRKLQALFHELRELVSVGNAKSQIFTPLSRVLSEYEYVLPRELTEVHPRLVEHFLSGKNNDHLRYRGLLLHGVKGPGKSEYFPFLAYCLGDRAKLFDKHAASIRGAPSPGEAIHDFYAVLEECAVREDMYYIVRFDEGDLLFAPYSEATVHHRETFSDSSTQKRSAMSQTTESTSTDKIDAVGLEILTAIKTAVGSELTRVFTVITSNREHFPEEIYRDGRLEKIQFHAMALPTIPRIAPSGRYWQVIPMYDDLRDTLPRLVAIMQSAHYRMHGQQNPTLAELHSDLLKFFDAHENNRFSPTSHLYDGFSGQSLHEEYVALNSELMTDLLAFLGYKIDFSRGTDWDLREQLRFDGIIDPTKHGDPMAEKYFSPGATKHGSPEVRRLTKLVASEAAGFYVQESARFQTLESAKTAVAQFVFPQLRGDISAALIP